MPEKCERLQLTRGSYVSGFVCTRAFPSINTILITYSKHITCTKVNQVVVGPTNPFTERETTIILLQYDENRFTRVKGRNKVEMYREFIEHP